MSRIHLMEIDAVFQRLDSKPTGLSQEQAIGRLAQNGPNRLEEKRKKTLFARILGQISDPMILVLISAAILSAAVGEAMDAVIIFAVVVLNSVLGIVQEGKAEKAIEALQKISSPRAKVRRNGQVRYLPTEEIVTGDVVILEAGVTVPADVRLIETSALRIEEAALTGESMPSEKHSRAMEQRFENAVPADRDNMAFMGTNVLYGRGQGLVTAVGMATEMGKIAGLLLGDDEEKTPLQKKLSELSRILSIGVLGICAFIFAFSVMKNGGIFGGHLLEVFMLSISLAVAAIPEGLVAVVTVVLSVGVTKMSKRNAIVRKLMAVETLGCTQVICSDKTGTLTQNKMTVVETTGDVSDLAKALVLCNDAVLSEDEKQIIGDPTESALIEFALKNKYSKNRLEEQMPRIADVPFDSERKLMTTVHQASDGKIIAYTKGAPDELIKRCTRIITEDNKTVLLTDSLRQKITEQNLEMAGRALRVLGGACREISSLPENPSLQTLENDLTFLGLAGMADPIRPEVLTAINTCRRAGIRPVIITGDHKNTAVAIAAQLGILGQKDLAVTGEELSNISDEKFEQTVHRYAVYARVQPEHKVRIVQAWKKLGKVTAMTGDGANDAPAIKVADIGIGMGITGTDVTKNVADIVLADDNFASIVNAVEEGRRIYDNIRKTVQFLLSSNLSEVVSIFVATIMNFQIFTPVHILWINLVTDTFPAIALGMEDAESDIMEKPPRDASEGIFSNGLGTAVLVQGGIIGVLTLVSYFAGNASSHIAGMTMAFLTLSLCEIFHSLNLRSREKSIFSLRTHNKALTAAMLLAFLLTIAVIYIPGVNTAFHVTPLSGGKFWTAFFIAASILPIVEAEKYLRRRVLFDRRLK